MSKRVTFFIGKLSSGGAERAVSNISLNLSNSISQEILLFGSSAKIIYPHLSKIHLMDNFHHGNYIEILIAFFSRLSKLKKLKQKHNGTTISFLEYPNLINALTRKHGKTYVSVRNHMSTKHSKGLKAIFWNATIKYLYGKTDGIIAVSEEIKRDLINSYGLNEDKIIVIYNSYPIEEIRELCAEELDNEYVDIFRSPVIITAGRLNKQKGHWHLIRSFSKVKKQVPDAKLVFLGEGELYEYLVKLSKELGIQEDVHFLGFQINPFKFIARSSIFIMSSLYEGFPNALAEAQACGVPVISSDCLSGPREILAPNEFRMRKIDYGINIKRYGILTPVCDGKRYAADDELTEEELIMADHMITLLRDEELAVHFRKQSLKRIEDFHIKNIIKRWESII